MWAEERAVLAVLSQLWKFELHAALAAALLGLFAFWLCHEIVLLLKCLGRREIVQSARIKEPSFCRQVAILVKVRRSLSEFEDFL